MNINSLSSKLKNTVVELHCAIYWLSVFNSIIVLPRTYCEAYPAPSNSRPSTPIQPDTNQCKAIQSSPNPTQAHRRPSYSVFYFFSCFSFLFLFLFLSLHKRFSFYFLTRAYRWSVQSGVFSLNLALFNTDSMPTDGATLLWYSGARRWRNYVLNHLFSERSILYEFITEVACCSCCCHSSCCCCRRCCWFCCCCYRL